ncbi:hypothetical protein VTK73DRAFT_4188 [Phialemonium thermophilum]|uniref:RRM domain-containing protein n=1 Tax=Phialemonium thermophilum TaxID=223376 RepID=A0ABR3VAV4_9PEZI
MPETDSSNKAVVPSTAAAEGTGVIYVGHIPHGFYEHQMREYFSQFGEVLRLRLSRNKKTGASKHYAFVEFAEAATADIVAKTMDHYMLFGHNLRVRVVPPDEVHPDLWRGANRRFKRVPWNTMAGRQLEKPAPESTWLKRVGKEERRRRARAQKLAELGYEFEVPSLKAVEAAAGGAGEQEEEKKEAVKAIEAAKEG